MSRPVNFSSCPVNFSTVKKGIENKAAQMLTQSGQFERVDQTSVRVTDTTSNYNKAITDVNNAFGEELVKKVNYQNISTQGQIVSEKTIRDLAARMSDRIGIPIKFESDRTKEYKGKLENNTAVINLTYATLDTPIHEILGHPIIRAIKNRSSYFKEGETAEFHGYGDPERVTITKIFDDTLEVEFRDSKGNIQKADLFELTKAQNTLLYQNLLKELEYGKGKEILDRVKRDYSSEKQNPTEIKLLHTDALGTTREKIWTKKDNKWFEREFEIHESNIEMILNNPREGYKLISTNAPKQYTLEEQQEEAIVELLGLYTADKLDKVKDGKLISLLKRLLKEMKAFMKSLIGQKEVEIDKLPDNMTLGDLADLLAYSNSKLILPGNEVVYTTPDNQQFKTYAEASKHISDLAKSVEEVDLKNVNLSETNIIITDINDIPVNQFYSDMGNLIKQEGNKWVEYTEGGNWVISDKQVLKEFNTVNELAKDFSDRSGINNFIEKNKEYEQSKEIIEEWKKVNNIQYNPEEVYSRGQGFYSIAGAFADFDVKLMFQNLLAHIEDNKKAGGAFTISATTDVPDHSKSNNSLVTKNYGRNIYYKIFPKSEDILWATPEDCASGSVIDAAEKTGSKLGKELTGVSYTKYPSPININRVQPSLAETLDETNTRRNFYNYNELGINLTTNNFRLEYDDGVPYSTKKIIDSINSILDQKYGKLVKPEIKTNKFNTSFLNNIIKRGYVKADEKQSLKDNYNIDISDSETSFKHIEKIKNVLNDNIIGIQPTQTNETLKENIESVKSRLKIDPYEDFKYYPTKIEEFKNDFTGEDVFAIEIGPDEYGEPSYEYYETRQEAEIALEQKRKPKNKEYTSQALINTKIAKLKEVAKKYPRSLIRSEVVRTKELYPGEFSGFKGDELPFQKIPTYSIQPSDNLINTYLKAASVKETTTPIKPGVAELFEQNPKLANAVYETLGFGSEISDVKYNRTFQNEEYHNAFVEGGLDAVKGGLDAVKKVIEKNKKQELSAAKQLSKEVDLLLEFEELNNKTNKTNRENDRVVELYVILKNSKELDFEYSLKEMGLPNTYVKPAIKVTPEQKQQALQLYSQYLDTIFPDSKVDDIVYHSTTSKFDKFNKMFSETSKAFHFHDGWFAMSKDMYVLLNILNPNTTETIPDAITNKRLEIFKSNNQDGIIVSPMSDILELIGKNKKEYVVFEPEQIHVLGSKKDIEGFKKWIKSETETVRKDGITPSSSKPGNYSLLEEMILKWSEKNNVSLNKTEGEILNLFEHEKVTPNETIEEFLTRKYCKGDL